MKTLSDAQQRALLALPINGPYGGEGYGWWREWGEITQIAGKWVPFRTVAILVERGLANKHPGPPILVQLTPRGRALRFEIWRSRK